MSLSNHLSRNKEKPSKYRQSAGACKDGPRAAGYEATSTHSKSVCINDVTILLNSIISIPLILFIA